MTRELIPDRIIEYAVAIWCDMLKAPRFDNGDNSAHGIIAQGLAGMNAEKPAADPDLHDKIETFRALLVTRLKFLRDHDGERTGVVMPHGHHECHWLPHNLSCDYGPDRLLAEIAEAAGISYSLFSWKTHVDMDLDNVCVSPGYTAPYIRHYILDDHRWFVCRLTGEDVPAILDHVRNGGTMPVGTIIEA